MGLFNYETTWTFACQQREEGKKILPAPNSYVNNNPILWSMQNAIQQQQEQIAQLQQRNELAAQQQAQLKEQQQQIRQQQEQIAGLQGQLTASWMRVTKTVGALKAENADLKARLERLERSIISSLLPPTQNKFT